MFFFELEMIDNGMIEVCVKVEKNFLGLEIDFIVGLGGLEIYRGFQVIMLFIEWEDFSFMDKIIFFCGEGFQVFVYVILMDVQYQDIMVFIDKVFIYFQVYFVLLFFFRECSFRNFIVIFEIIFEQLQDVNEVFFFVESQLFNLVVFENRSFNYEGMGYVIFEEVILLKFFNEE